MILKLILALTVCLPITVSAHKPAKPGPAGPVAYGLYDFKEKKFVYEKYTAHVRSIASITKLFTAYTVVESNVDLEEKIKVQGKSGGRFARGAMVERYELLRATLMSSDNLAAESLAHAHPGGFEAFIHDANLHVERMKLKNTKIVDSTGLLAGNVSTIEDLTEFLSVLRQHRLIQKLSREKQYVTQYQRGKKNVTVPMRNTNPSVWVYDEIVLTKTGFTSAAKFCVAMLVEKEGKIYAVVTLGNRTPQNRSKVVDEIMREINFEDSDK